MLGVSSTSQGHSAFLGGRSLGPLKAARQGLAVEWQEDSSAPDLCAFNAGDENLPPHESSGENCSEWHSSELTWLQVGAGGAKGHLL